MNTGDRNCYGCNMIIDFVSPMMWIESECYHEKCARAKMEIEKKIVGMFKTKSNKWDNYFLNIALEVSKLANCPRKAVGSVIVNEDNNIIATGFNGSISKLATCETDGCLLINNHCQRVLHSEINSVIQCAKLGKSCKNCKIYITLFPCLSCFKVLAQVGINKILYLEDYKNDELVYKFAKEKGIEIIKC